MRAFATGLLALLAMPAVALAVAVPDVSFEGIGGGPFPPADPNIDVSATQVVEMTNGGYAVFTKAGALIQRGTLGSIFAAAGDTPCSSEADGDPIVIHDRAADRWLLSFFSISSGTGSYQCIAVSQSPDATGPYHLYQYLLSSTRLHDYPKLVVWGDSYLLATFEFAVTGTGESAVGPALFAFDRTKLLAGDGGVAVPVPVPDSLRDVVLLPAHADEAVAAPPGEPAYVLGANDLRNRLEVLRVAVAWPAGTVTVSGPQRVPVPAFDGEICTNAFLHCVPQFGTTARLDSLSDRLLWRVQYRRRPDGAPTLVASHTVDANGQGRAGVRWYQLEPSGPSLRIVQSGTFAPNGTQRFMGSAAMNATGDIALGYSVAGSQVRPGIRYTGRLASDPPGTMPQGEGVILTGGGVQTRRFDEPGFTRSARWGDYSTTVIDPVDGCTFWHVNQFLRRSDAEPQTRIAAFRLAGCAPPPGPDVTPPSDPPVIAPILTPRRPGAYWFRFPGAADPSGIEGYSIVVDHVADTVPDATIDTRRSRSRQRLGRGTWYFHVRTLDRAGNWSATARTAGPFRLR